MRRGPRESAISRMNLRDDFQGLMQRLAGRRPSAEDERLVALFQRYGVPQLNATECSIEEIASRVIDRMGIERRLRP